MFEFQGRIAPSHLDVVLNVLDVDGDRWCEVLFRREAHESTSLTLDEYSATGFDRTGRQLSHGG